MQAFRKNSALALAVMTVLVLVWLLIRNPPPKATALESDSLVPVATGESSGSITLMDDIPLDGDRDAEIAEPAAAIPLNQVDSPPAPARGAPDLRKELAGMKRQLIAQTFGQFSEYWASGAYTEYDRLTPAALSDDNGNPLPNEVRAGLNGGFRVVVLHPDTHPEACALMISVRSLQAEIQAIEAAY